MSRDRSRRHAILSPELGDGDFDIALITRTGRPRRKARRTQTDSPFVDSAIAVSDPADSDITASDASARSTISMARYRKRKRKRSPSPPVSDDTEESADTSDTDNTAFQHSNGFASNTSIQINIKNLTVNIPPGHRGPVLLQLDLPSDISKQSSVTRNASKTRRTAYLSSSDLKSSQTKQMSSSRHSIHAGFLDIPAEIRNQIYRHVFVAEDHFNFDSPSNFSRGAAFLRTCKQVYEEARSILYSENHFLFVRRGRRHGSYWEPEWSEVGYKAIRRFLRLIGPTNIGLLRHVTLLLEDATPCLNPEMTTADDRRFVYDDVLMSVLRHLGDHAKLQKLDLHFHGS